MTTKVNSRCYRFADVDFEPESRSLYWRDDTITTLTYEECRLLEMLCYHAGEVLSARVLYTATSLPDTSFSQHQNTLCALLSKAYKSGEKVLPLDVVGDHGYRISLPQKTYHKENEVMPVPVSPSLDLAIEAPKRSSYLEYVPAGIVGICTALLGTVILMYVLN